MAMSFFWLKGIVSRTNMKWRSLSSFRITELRLSHPSRRLFTTVGSPGVKYTSPGQKLHLKAGGNQRVTSCWSR